MTQLEKRNRQRIERHLAAIKTLLDDVANHFAAGETRQDGVCWESIGTNFAHVWEAAMFAECIAKDVAREMADEEARGVSDAQV